MYIYHIDENPSSLVTKSAADLKWTTEPPTEPGLYRSYFKSMDGKFEHLEYWEEVEKQDNRLEVRIKDYSESLDEYISDAIRDGYKVYWLGPLPVPDPPTGSEKPING
jgi:hypothetical protein